MCHFYFVDGFWFDEDIRIRKELLGDRVYPLWFRIGMASPILLAAA